LNSSEQVQGEITPYLPVKPLVTPEQAADEWARFEELKRQLLNEGDYQAIAGKRYIKRSGFRKIAVYFGLSDRILEQERVDREDGSFLWRIVVEVKAPNGRTSTGVGVCDSRERNFAHLEHDVLATCHTRAKSRAISDMVAGGVVSAEEVAVSPSSDNGEPAERTEATNSSEGGYYFVDREAVLNTLERSGLDSTVLGVYWDNQALVIKPLEYLGDVWMKYMDALKPLGAEWVRLGKESHWEIKAAGENPR